MRCLFCVMLSGGLVEGNHPFLPEDVCDAHESVSGIEEYLAAHPNGAHTGTCGCVTLPEAHRIWQAAPETDPPTHTLTYLARGIQEPPR